ncbi:ribosomal protein S5 domain 2-type protein [Dunaliella salina]|uniref:Ribosomal protein S5 domain 2-type protein n=1 Tax=Dunaliella salina TaxID=3046 RepID=A0ABQ7GJQ5_DUNSA|nr:ribosomal protein S5 domain 2-type protein [Dunaliella salina]|eukprot:KAF5834847.1 ribosomal protein S5 domain 2-type protein [Dunaliella salina]
MFRASACFRVGLLGNPSDGYFGKAIALSLANFSCEVSLTPSHAVSFQPHPEHDKEVFSSLEDLSCTCAKYGYTGGIHLLKATCKKFYDYCRLHQLQGSTKEKHFSISYDTNIPRQLGLSGSSALIYATVQALVEYFGVNIPKHDRPALVLAVEKEELGINAGWMDRVIQVWGGLCYMDFAGLSSGGHLECIPLDPKLLPPLDLIWADSPSESGKVHSRVRQRWMDGDPEIVQGMQQAAKCAEEGRVALQDGNWPKIAHLMNTNFDLRRKMFGDAVIGEANIKMVEVARSVGAACKFAGSGGAVVAFCPLGVEQRHSLQQAATNNGFHIAPVEVAPAQ